MSKRHTIEYVKNYMLERNIELLSTEYINNKTKLKSKCLTCGYIFDVIFNDIVGGHGCGKCADIQTHNKQRHSIEYIKQTLINKNIILLSTEYKGIFQKIKCQCKHCENIWFAPFNNISSSSYGCPKCAMERRRQTCLEKYGVAYPMQYSEIATKSARSQTSSKVLYHWKTNKEIICQGTYEIKVVNYLNKDKTEYKWKPQIFTMPNKKTYTPDLFLSEQNLWIEIKGYFRKDAFEKWDWFHKEYPNSELWNKEKLKEMRIL